MKVKLSQIRENPLNKNIYSMSDINDLADSIKQLGLLEAIVVDKSFTIISGHRRYTACKQLKIKEVECIVKNVKSGDEVLHIIHYNKQRLKSTKELLNEINHLKKYYSVGKGKRTDLTSDNPVQSRKIISEELKISEGNISKLLFIERHEPKFIDLIDKGILTINQAYTETQRKLNQKNILEHKKETVTNVIKNDNYTLYNKSSDDMSEVKSESVQLIYTSPPYYKKRVYTKNKNELGMEKTVDKYVAKLSKHFEECYRVLKKTGSLFLNIGDTYVDGDLQCVPHKVVSVLKEKGWILRNTIIWKKSNPKPSSSKSNLNPTYEFIFHLIKSKKYYYKLIKTPTKDIRPSAKVPRHHNLKNGVNVQSHYIQKTDGKNPGDYWDYDVVTTSVANNVKFDTVSHPAPFPHQIVILPLLSTTKPNDIVLDCFSGSGTTGKVALQFGRKYIGYDINKNFISEFIKQI